MENCYYTNITLDKRKYGVYILTKEDDQFDLQIEIKGRLCGDDFIKLRKYLIDEGYVEEAREYNKNLIG